MAKKFLPSHLDNAKKLLSEGLFLYQIAERIGFGSGCISHHLRSNGVAIPISHEAHNKINADPTPFVKAYVGGESELSISLRTGFGRNVIRRLLVESGVDIRSQSEANTIRMRRIGSSGRKSLTEASHIGAKAINSEKRRIMLERTALARCKRCGVGELEITTILRERGLPCEAQVPCGVYNIDIAVGTVAVELAKGAGSGLTKKRFPERCKYLADHGYSIFVIVFKTKESLFGNLDDVVSLLEKTYRLPPVERKHRVIRCSCERFTRTRDDKGQFSCVPSPERFSYSVREINPGDPW